MRVDLDEAKRLSDALAFAEDKQIVDAMLAELRLRREIGVYIPVSHRKVRCIRCNHPSTVGEKSKHADDCPVKALEQME